jgi:hypothetical protein
MGGRTDTDISINIKVRNITSERSEEGYRDARFISVRVGDDNS